MAITIRNTTSFKSGKIDMASLLSTLKKDYLAPLVLGAFTASSGAALAESPIDKSTIDAEKCGPEFAHYFDNFADAGVQAENCALSEGGIGMVIGYGPYEGAPNPEDVAKLFAHELLKLGESSSYHIVESEKPGYAILFRNGFTTQGPMSLPEGAKALKDIVSEKRRFYDYLASSP